MYRLQLIQVEAQVLIQDHLLLTEVLHIHLLAEVHHRTHLLVEVRVAVAAQAAEALAVEAEDDN